MTLKQLINLYIKYVHRHGFSAGDLVLAKYLPREMVINGTVHDVPVEKWVKLAEDLSV